MQTTKIEDIETPFGTVRTDWDQVLCPQKTLAEDADVEESGTVRVCGRPLYLNWTTSVSVTMDPEPMKPEDGVTSSWALECDEGHVLATSDGQDENPAPPRVASLLPLLATRGD
jgi:hypothetical protein